VERPVAESAAADARHAVAGVQTPEPAVEGGECRLHRRLVAEVGCEGRDGPAVGRDDVREFGQMLGIPGRDEDVRALGHERPSGAAAHPRGARHEHAAPGEPAGRHRAGTGGATADA
jgi:hypothetical protein